MTWWISRSASTGIPSLQLFVALADLADVLTETGSPEYEAIFLRAHEVDDALQDEPDSDDSDAHDDRA